jgi:hypothetical protein
MEVVVLSVQTWTDVTNIIVLPTFENISEYLVLLKF